MNKQTWDILTEVLEEEPEHQLVKLKELCKGSADLYQEITNLISKDNNIDEWWNTNSRFNDVLLFDVSKELVQQFPLNDELIDEKLGAYTIKKSIGEGGMGKVFLAERSDGAFERNVAIKVMSFHLNLSGIQKRFFKEQKILASLNHPGIAQLYDATISEKGMPYLVMEYVEGRNLIEYVDYKNFGLQQRIELFIKICDAVQYAHRNLVIHKDLKPSNILVNDEGSPKVLDFGVSGLLDDVTEQADIEIQDKSFTLKYSAPEQIQDSNITTSADVYSLGIILFELLVDKHPLNFSDLSRKQAEQAALKKEFPLASVESGSKKLKGDLDSIILKATQKRQESRYQTVQELSEDLKRYQKNEPILARKTGVSELGIKLFKRNPASSTLAILLILGGILFSTFYNFQIKRERDLAKLEAEKATVTKDYLLNLFKTADPLNKPGEKQTVGDFIAFNIQNLSGLDNEPAVKEEAAYILAQVAFNVGAYYDAESLFVESYRINTELNEEITIQQANTLDKIGNIYVQLADYSVAKNLFDSALVIKRKLLKDDDVKIGTSYSLIGNSLAHLGDLDSAEVLLGKSLQIYSNNKQLSPEFLIANIEGVADLSREQKDFERSVRLLEENIVLRKKHLPDDKRGMSLSYNNIGFSYKNLEEYPEAIEAYKVSLEILETVYGDSHPNTLTTLSNLSNVYQLTGQTRLAEEKNIEGLDRVRKSFGENHWRVGQSYSRLGGFYYQNYEYFKSIESYKKAITIYSETLGKSHFWTNRAKLNLALSEALSGEINKGENLFIESLTEIKENLNGRLTYYNYGSITVIQENLTKHKELDEFYIAISDFLTWHDAAYPN